MLRPKIWLGLTDWVAFKFGQFFLHLAAISRCWPLRHMTEPRVERVGTRYRLTSIEGVSIEALRIARFDQPNRARNQPYSGAGMKLPIVFAHGWLETKEFHLREAELLARHGHDVILFDMRRHGCSTGKCVTFGVKEKHDVVAVIDNAQRRGWVGNRVITMGFSLGAATMLQHATIDQRVAAVVALAPFYNLTEAIRSFHRAHKAPIRLSFVQRAFELAFRRYAMDIRQASPIDEVRRTEVPVLLAVGQRDNLLPDAQHTRRLAEAKIHGRCYYVQIPDAGHMDFCCRQWPGRDEAILDFCCQVSK